MLYTSQNNVKAIYKRKGSIGFPSIKGYLKPGRVKKATRSEYYTDKRHGHQQVIFQDVFRLPVWSCRPLPPLPLSPQDFGKPRVVPWKNPKKKDEGFYVGSDTGQVTGNDPVMLVLLISTTLTLSYLLLG